VGENLHNWHLDILLKILILGKKERKKNNVKHIIHVTYLKVFRRINILEDINRR